MNQLKRITRTLLLSILMFSLPIQAQEKADMTYLFRSMPGKVIL